MVASLEEKANLQSSVLMKSLTWTRESHGLFDYESKSIKKNDLKASTSGVLMRKQDSVQFVKQKDVAKLEDEGDQTTSLFNLV